MSAWLSKQDCDYAREGHENTGEWDGCSKEQKESSNQGFVVYQKKPWAC